MIYTIGAAAVTLWIAGGLLGSAAQVAKVYSDRLGVSICEASQVQCR